MRKKYLAIIGATASGKSALALRLAERLKGELINCDSVQIYKGFNLGAAKPSEDERNRIPHHLLDIREGPEDYDARTFARDAENKITEILQRGKLPILVGGTGLYLKALWQDGFHDLPKDQALRDQLKVLSLEELRSKLDEIDPKRSQEIHDNDRFRLQRAVEVATLLGHSVKDLPSPESKRSEAFVIAMTVERTKLKERIAQRTKIMLNEGLVDEVKGLLMQGHSKDSKPMQSIGYHEVIQYLGEEIKAENLEESIIIATRQYAKRQETLFKKIEKDFLWTESETFENLLEQITANVKLP